MMTTPLVKWKFPAPLACRTTLRVYACRRNVQLDHAEFKVLGGSPPCCALDGLRISRLLSTHNTSINKVRILKKYRMGLGMAVLLHGYISSSFLQRSKTSRVHTSMQRQRASTLLAGQRSACCRTANQRVRGNFSLSMCGKLPPLHLPDGVAPLEHANSCLVQEFHHQRSPRRTLRPTRRDPEIPTEPIKGSPGEGGAGLDWRELTAKMKMI